MPHDPQPVTILVEPAAQCGPLADERLVGHLDRRFPAHRRLVEAEQAGGTEGVDQLARNAGQLAAQHPAAGVLAAFTERHQPPEQPTHRSPTGLVELAGQLVGPAGERSDQAADFGIGGLGQQPRHSPLVQFGEHVLQQRQRAGLVGNVGHDPGDEAGFELAAGAQRRLADRPFQFVGSQRSHQDRRRLEQRREAGHPQRPVDEIGPDREHQAQVGVGVAHGLAEPFEEAAALVVVFAEGEQLFELVDDHEQFAVVADQPFDGPGDAAGPVGELVEQPFGRVDGHAQQGRLELLEGVPGGHHGDGEPLGGPGSAIGAGHSAPAQCRQQPRPHHRGLAGARRTDHGDQAAVGARSSQSFHQLADQPITTEEITSVGLGERSEALVGVGTAETHHRRALPPGTRRRDVACRPRGGDERGHQFLHGA